MRKLDGTLLPQSSGCDAVREDKTLLQFAEARGPTFHPFEFLPPSWSCLASRLGTYRFTSLAPLKNQIRQPTWWFYSRMNNPLALASVFDFFVRQSANEVGIREIGGSEQGRGMRRFFRPLPLSSPLSDSSRSQSHFPVAPTKQQSRIIEFITLVKLLLHISSFFPTKLPHSPSPPRLTKASGIVKYFLQVSRGPFVDSDP